MLNEDQALPMWERVLLTGKSEQELAIEDLAVAVRAARKSGLTVEVTVSRTIVVSL